MTFENRGFLLPYVDLLIAFDPLSQKLPDYPLAEIQRAGQNDDYLSA